MFLLQTAQRYKPAAVPQQLASCAVLWASSPLASSPKGRRCSMTSARTGTERPRRREERWNGSQAEGGVSAHAASAVPVPALCQPRHRNQGTAPDPGTNPFSSELLRGNPTGSRQGCSCAGLSSSRTPSRGCAQRGRLLPGKGERNM